MEDDQERL
jgi:hypothetical protein